MRAVPHNAARRAKDRLLKSWPELQICISRACTRRVSAAGLAPTPSEVVTQFQSDSSLGVRISRFYPTPQQQSVSDALIASVPSLQHNRYARTARAALIG